MKKFIKNISLSIFLISAALRGMESNQHCIPSVEPCFDTIIEPKALVGIEGIKDFTDSIEIVEGKEPAIKFIVNDNSLKLNGNGDLIFQPKLDKKTLLSCLKDNKKIPVPSTEITNLICEFSNTTFYLANMLSDQKNLQEIKPSKERNKIKIEGGRSISMFTEKLNPGFIYTDRAYEFIEPAYIFKIGRSTEPVLGANNVQFVPSLVKTNSTVFQLIAKITVIDQAKINQLLQQNQTSRILYCETQLEIYKSIDREHFIEEELKTLMENFREYSLTDPKSVDQELIQFELNPNEMLFCHFDMLFRRLKKNTDILSKLIEFKKIKLNLEKISTKVFLDSRKIFDYFNQIEIDKNVMDENLIDMIDLSKRLFKILQRKLLVISKQIDKDLPSKYNA